MSADDDEMMGADAVDEAAVQPAMQVPPSDEDISSGEEDIAAGADAVEVAAEVDGPDTDAPEAATFRYDEKFYAPVSAEAPTGAAIEFYHFSDMDQELAWPLNDFGRPDVEQRPNFRAVRDTALGFLNGIKDIKATRDVRPMLALVIAEAGDKGPVGLAKALDLFVSTATTYWDAIHPQKEDEDDDELMTRMEEMRKYMNPSVFSLAVESVGLARSPRVGDLTTRTFGIAATKVTPRSGEFAPNSDALVALLAEEDEARVRVTEAHDAYRYAIERLKVLEAFLEERPDVDPVDLAIVADALEKQAAFLAPFVGTSADVDLDTAEADPLESAGSSQPDSMSAPVSGPKTLEEAMAILDDILMFYARNGRSSPVPLGLIALRDLMAGDFNSWITQTASSGLAEAAINLAAVDASRLSTFASGEAPAAVAPTSVEFDFTEIDAAIYEAETAFAVIDNAVYQHQMTLPPEEGEEANTVLAAEVQQMREALDKIQAAKVSMETPSVPASGEAGTADNATEGDARHSRITDRNAVKQSLDAVAAYFEREEPSSPAPGYLRRLRSLVDARFSDIARELMPEDGGEAKLRLEPKTNLR